MDGVCCSDFGGVDSVRGSSTLVSSDGGASSLSTEVLSGVGFDRGVLALVRGALDGAEVRTAFSGPICAEGIVSFGGKDSDKCPSFAVIGELPLVTLLDPPLGDFPLSPLPPFDVAEDSVGG